MKGHITRGRVDGSWYLRVECHATTTVSEATSQTFRGTKAGAEKRLRQFLHEIETGGYPEDERLTTSDLCRRWLDSADWTLEFQTRLLVL
jgi:hypothetical protein